MGAIDNRITKLEEQCKHRPIEPIVLFERYPGQTLKEAKVEAGVSDDADDYQVFLVTAEDAATL